MRRNIDVLSVVLILAAIALGSELRNLPAIQYHSARLARFTGRQLEPLRVRAHLPALCLTRE